MNLTISGHHLEVTPALRGYVTSKLDRITRHFDQVEDVHEVRSLRQCRRPRIAGDRGAARAENRREWGTRKSSGLVQRPGRERCSRGDRVAFGGCGLQAADKR